MKKKQEVAICILTNSDLYSTKYCINNLTVKTKISFKLYIYYFNDNILEYAHSLKDKGIEIEIKKAKDKYAETVNDFLSLVDEKYSVIFPSNTIVNEDWLLSLKVEYKNFDKSGCISLKSTTNDLIISSLLYNTEDIKQDDIMKTIYVDPKNIMKGLIFFSNDKIKNIGFLDITENFKGLELVEWTFRFLAEGYFNYFLKYHNVLNLDMEDDILFPLPTEIHKITFKTIINNLLIK
tara:strand:+ start:7583 stop:8290 length:708 start_codon:yes stop_codon:yes gene_type:complete